MRKALYTIGAASVLASCAIALADADSSLSNADDVFSASGSQIEIEDFIGTLVVETSSTSSISVEMMPGEAVAAGEMGVPTLRDTSNGLLIIGDKDAKIRNCSSDGRGGYEFRLKGHERRPLSDFPIIRVAVPENTEIELEINGGVADVESLRAADVHVRECGDVVLGDIEKKLEASISGSGNITAGDVGNASLIVRGSGGIEVGDVDGATKVSIAGSGDVSLGMVNGPVHTSISGSGNVRLGGGAGDLDVGIRGSGDVRIEGGDFADAEISITGSGEVKMSGVVTDLSVSIAGSGDVNIAEASGEISVNRIGGGDIVVNGKRWTGKGWDEL